MSYEDEGIYQRFYHQSCTLHVNRALEFSIESDARKSMIKYHGFSKLHAASMFSFSCGYTFANLGYGITRLCAENWYANCFLQLKLLQTSCCILMRFCVFPQRRATPGSISLVPGISNSRFIDSLLNT